MSIYEIPAATVKTGSTVIPVRRRLSTRWISVLTLVALVAIWWAVTATGLIEPLFLPPPSAVLQKGWLLATGRSRLLMRAPAGFGVERKPAPAHARELQ